MEMSDTVDRYLKSRADLANPDVGQPPHPLDENRHRYALDRVQIDRTRIRDRIRTRLQDHLTGQPANVRRARGDERAPQPWDGGIAREDDDRPPANIGARMESGLRMFRACAITLRRPCRYCKMRPPGVLSSKSP